MDTVMTQTFDLPPQLRTRESILSHMAKVAHFNDEPSFRLLQESILHLSAKAEQKAGFADEEKNFLKVLFESPWWGGYDYGLNESKAFLDGQLKQTVTFSDVQKRALNISDPIQLSLAKMAQYYVNGEGQYYSVSLPLYQNSLIVKDVVLALKQYISEQYSLSKPVTLLESSNTGFLRSKYAVAVEQKRTRSNVLGYIFNDGTMMLEQKDPRIMNVGNRFKITAMTSSMGAYLMTRWRIEGKYIFESFSSGGVTGLPLSEALILEIPFGLSEHMTALNVASPFGYFTDWAERYPLVKM